MKYLFECQNCGAKVEKEIKMSDYDKEKDKQICYCSGPMKRIIEFDGAIGLCSGMYGCNTVANGWNK